MFKVLVNSASGIAGYIFLLGGYRLVVDMIALNAEAVRGTAAAVIMFVLGLLLLGGVFVYIFSDKPK